MHHKAVNKKINHSINNKHCLLISISICIYRKIEGSNILRLTINTTACEGTDNHIQYLEHVLAKVSLTFDKRGALEIRLTSPRNTESTLLQPRRGDQTRGGFREWPFLSTHYWGEKASGVWTMEIENTGRITNSGKCIV